MAVSPPPDVMARDARDLDAKACELARRSPDRVKEVVAYAEQEAARETSSGNACFKAGDSETAAAYYDAATHWWSMARLFQARLREQRALSVLLAHFYGKTTLEPDLAQAKVELQELAARADAQATAVIERMSTPHYGRHDQDHSPCPSPTPTRAIRTTNRATRVGRKNCAGRTRRARPSTSRTSSASSDDSSSPGEPPPPDGGPVSTPRFRVGHTRFLARLCWSASSCCWGDER